MAQSTSTKWQPKILTGILQQDTLEKAVSMPRSDLDLLKLMFTSRFIDEIELDYVNRGEAFFQVSGTGHEATVLFAQYLQPQDYLHCHYRDKALMLARGIAPREFFNSLLCNADGHSAGRQMSAHLSSPEHHILSLVGPIGNNALQAAGVAAEIKNREDLPIVYCSLGDGTSQQGEVLEAIAEAVRWELPILFVVEDNGYAISVVTRGKTFYSLPNGSPDDFYGLPLHRVNGRQVLECDDAIGRLVNEVRVTRRPALLILDVERLSNHTNADDERTYRNPEEISLAQLTGDPIKILRKLLVTRGVSEAKITDIEIQARAHVEREAAAALQGHQPAAIFDAKAKLPTSLMVKAEYRGSGDSLAMTMVEAIRETLRNKMAADSHVTLYGEDIEDPKGDVFGVTRGLTDAFPGRVKNSPVSESTIVGTSIGRALVGGRPVAFLQFADFLPLAFNQIATELGSMYWRTNGGWTCPVIIMVACGGYRPGLGPFHAHTFESILTHVPGVDVVMPSTAGDAAGMLNAAFESKRPTIFLYPKACLNDKTRATSADIDAQLVPVGKARTIRSGNDITLVAWGNTVPLCEKVAETLSTIGAAAEVIDLRWLSPWDDDMVCRSARRTGKLIVVHEDNKSSGLGAEVVATVVEHVAEHVECRRITRPDTFVPCHFGNQLDVLPSFRSILTAAAKMLDLDLQWSFADASDRSLVIVEAIGSSPADQTVTVLEVMVTTGQTISEGDPIASIECDKAVFELSAPTGGIVESVFLQDGQEAPVGTPLVGIRAQNNQTHTRQPVRENSGEPHLSRKKDQTGNLRFSSTPTGRSSVVMSNIYPVVGEKSLTNFDLSARFPQFNESDILSRTGISSRSIASEEQTTTAMAVEAALKALQGEKTNLEDIDLIICSTSTPEVISPSVACLVLAEINRAHGKACEIPAYDMLAACTGYLYALKAAWEHVQCNPKSRVLVITTERMSSIIDPYDFGTVALFGDAATATIIGGEGFLPNARVRLYKPVISAFGENGTILTVPTLGNDKFVQMNGKTVFVEAVRRMARILEVACEELGRQVTDLDFVIPHQANGRIIEAVRKRLKVSQSVVRNDIVNRGNTSSSTIPLALSQQSYGTPGQLSGLCAFGAGYTFGAAIIETLK